jgi:hypothetical protein
MLYIIILVIILIKNIEMSELEENANIIENMSKNEILKNIEELNIQYKSLIEKEVLLNQEMSELEENADKIKNMSKNEILNNIDELNTQYAELLRNEQIINKLQKIMSFDKSEIKNIENKIKDYEDLIQKIRLNRRNCIKELEEVKRDSSSKRKSNNRIQKYYFRNK